MLRRIWNRLFSNRSTARRCKDIQRRANRNHLRFESLESRSLLAAQVFSDQSDYAPGSTAYLTATGFPLGESVSFNITSDTPGPGQGSWVVSDGITDGSSADLDGEANGIIKTSWLVDPDGAYAGATLFVSATGLTSGDVATTTFTDAPPADTTGPSTTNLAVAPNPSNTAPTITAKVSDNGSGNNNIIAAEYFIDANPGPATRGTAMAASNAPFDNKTEDVTATISNLTFNGLSQGAHTVNVRGEDAVGNWGAFVNFVFTKDTIPPAVTAPDLAAADDTGFFNSDDKTSKTKPTFNGTADAGSNVQIFDGATLLGTANLVGTNWSFTVPNNKALSDGNHSIKATATDTAGNSTTSSALSVTVDTVKPVFDPSSGLDRSPAATGWFNISTGAPVFNYIASDAGTGLDPSSPTNGSHTFSEGTGQQFTFTVTDVAGNSASIKETGVNVDLTAPTIDASLDKSPAGTGWYNIATGAPTTTFTGSDVGGSGVANVTGPHLFGEGSHLSATGTVTDVAGNSTTQSFFDIFVDLTAPTIDASLDKSPAGTGWYNIATGAPTTTFTGSDVGGSGVANVTGPHLFGEGSHLSATGTVTDVAGNSTTQSFFDIFVDLTAPTIDASLDKSPAGTGWYNIATGAPTTTFTGSDVGGSGVANVTGPHLFGEGSHLSATGTVTDVAGNSTTQSFFDIFVDLTAPTIDASLDKSPAGTGWYNIATGAPTATFTGSDVGGSGVANVTGPHLFGEGSHLSATGTVTDVAGNSTTQSFFDIFVDLTAPTIDASLDKSPAGTGWYNIATGAPTATFTGSDVGGSGVANVTGPHLFGEGSHLSATGTVTDVAGNSTTQSFFDIFVDLTAPTIDASLDKSPAGTGWYNIATGAPTATFTGSDVGGSGVANVTGPHLFGEGSHLAATGTVTDVAGNSTTQSFFDIFVDLTAPTIDASLDKSPAGTGWYNIATGAPTATFTGSDVGGSGVANVTGPHLFGEGSHLSATGTVTDVAGNSTTQSFFDIFVDLTAPTTGLTPASGTYTPQKFNWSSQDTTSHVFSTQVTVDGTSVSTANSGPMIMPPGTHTIVVTTTDYAGNSKSDTRTYTVTGVGMVDGNVMIVGTDNADSIVVTPNGASSITVSLNGVTSVHLLGAGGHIIAYGLGANDTITENGNVSLEAHGGAGDDTITGGAGHDVLFGDAGNDTITGAAGNDVLIGGAGNDRLVGSAGDDILIAGDVIDLLLSSYDDLRTLSNKWSASSGGQAGALASNSDLATDDNPALGASDDVVDTGTDQLTGSAGHDWLVVSSNDKVTDAANDQKKDSDYIETI